MHLTMTLLLSALILLGSSGYSGASEPLGIIYTERESDDELGSSSSNYIDNQSYLQEFQKRRSGTVASPITIITIENSSCPRPANRFRGIEYYNGSTMLRYYQGYPVNCSRYFYTVRPPRKHHPGVGPRRHHKPRRGAESGRHRIP